MNRKVLLNILAFTIFIILPMSSCEQEKSMVPEPEVKMLMLENFLLVDGTGAQPVRDKIILIKDDSILKIDDKQNVQIPEECTIVNLKGYTLLPGFINTHVHKAYDEERLQKWLAAGVTTVRDLSARNLKDYIQLRDKYNKNPVNSRLVSANPIITAPGGYGWLTVDTSETAKKTVNNLIDNNVDIIKISLEDELQGHKWSLLSPELVKTIVDTAHARNIKVSVHVSHTRNLRTAIDAGVDEFAHMVVDKLDDKLIDEIVKKDIYFIPTLELWQGVSKMHNLKWDSIAMENLASFCKAGGKIAFGTDYEGYTCSFDQGFPITEVTLMKKSGISNMDIIVSATKNAAFICGLGKVLGTVQEGKKADILVVEGNPLEDISVLSKTQMVIHDGKIIVNKVSP